MKVVTESYFDILNDKEKFYKWFCLENNEDMNAFDISAQRSNRAIIQYIYDIVRKEDFLFESVKLLRTKTSMKTKLTKKMRST